MSAFPPRVFIQDKIDKLEVGDVTTLPELCGDFWDDIPNSVKPEEGKRFKEEVAQRQWPNLRQVTESASERSGDQQYIRT
ncbi:DUF1413 domain-containing protein [Pseudooceanicola spongiae]|uniref:DUF1413 domain-containing protein n=1 Tax=Pseudooceanicola spongiae TaxID=2613965 RepID=A0A7L9WKW3_9RHOB|nr:DUF1413 domain-containing protein [Pseudooceanicola spongiae]QOL80474.1 DUF1413 domain-containing protein [Pseudooceanicola spongiae]